MANLIPKFKEIKAFVFDVDGVMTPGQVLVTEEGHMLRSVSIKDGFAVQHAVKSGYVVGIISGGKSEGVRKRFEGLGVPHIYMGQGHKMEAFRDFCKKANISPDQVAYMGDDLPDIPVMNEVGLSCAPNDACSDVIDVAMYISEVNGGQGCARDLIERTMKLQGTWFNEETHKW
ncbi:MAG: HAD-IIIA family hydrolase [Bacteroidia bacterium]|jgi:3-deoxy-D-manno-octulosonate 8-phosphate phosphatase (KDO 8-P phosphatase)|nr:HAD-IIIA family hydrolase [Bacteroidia bacterium]